MKDYFSILGVSKQATEDEIKRAYRTLAMKHHPDRGGDQAKFQEIQEAYSTLSEPQRRAQWEQESADPRRHAGHQGFQGFNFSFGEDMDINEIFRSFGAGGNPFGGFQQVRRNRDLHAVIELELASTLEPQKKHISVQHLNGERTTVTVDIPRGIRPGMQMKYAGHGDKSQSNLPAGDLYIDFSILNNPEFQVEGIDLVKTLQLDCLDAMTGTASILTGLDGTKFTWTIPSGTQAGTKFRVAGQGLWAVDHPVRGNLIIVVNISVPTELTPAQLDIVSGLKEQLSSKP